MEKYLEKLILLKIKCLSLWETHKDKRQIFILGTAFLALLIVYLIGKGLERTTHVFHSDDTISFEGGRILGGKDDLYKRQEFLLSKEVKAVKEGEEKLAETVRGLSERVNGILDRLKQVQQSPPAVEAKVTPPSPPGDLFPSPGDMAANKEASSINVGGAQSLTRSSREGGAGPSIINFPVKATPPREEGVVLPAGSFVRAKMMTGVEAPEGKSYPVLLQLDFAYIGPNESKIDLSGCFGISKAQGDLSTERVQMQLTKLSCVSKQGKMFEKEVNGFIADNKDNSFAVIGEVNSKQDRVAAQAFLSSIVEGVGKALQQSQTTAQTTPLGGSQSVITGDSAKYIAAGGASQAASQVTQWYLKQAESLLPTINVGSGQDIWIVMQDKVELPNWYFKKSIEKSVFGYFTALTE